MNWWCKFGFHDWEYIRCLSKANHELEVLNQSGRFIGETFPRVYQRICIACGKYEDTIAIHKKEVLLHRNESIRRHKLAKKLMGNSI